MKKSSKKTLPPVTAEEAPYTLPEGWKWVRLGDVAEISKEKTDDIARYKAWPYVGLENMETGQGIISCADAGSVKSTKNLFHIGDVLYGKLRPYLNKHDVATYEGICSTDILVFKVSDKVDSHYLNQYLNQREFINYAVSNSKGINLPRVSPKVIEQAPFPLASVQDQKHILQTITQLFSKLDEAEKKIDQALAAFPARRAALLHRAFQGDLTKEWRKEHGVGMESWIQNRLGDYATVQYGYTASATEEVVGPKFLRITDIQDGIVNWDTVPYCSINDTDMEKYGLSKGDILVARTGATTGKSYLVTSEVESVFASYLIRIKMNGASLLEKYLYLFMQSPEYWRTITSFSQGIAQPGVNGSKLKELLIPVPTLPEQQEIVRLLGGLLAKEDKAKALAASMKENIARLRAAILARAFRGAL